MIDAQADMFKEIEVRSSSPGSGRALRRYSVCISNPVLCPRGIPTAPSARSQEVKRCMWCHSQGE